MNSSVYRTNAIATRGRADARGDVKRIHRMRTDLPGDLCSDREKPSGTTNGNMSVFVRGDPIACWKLGQLLSVNGKRAHHGWSQRVCAHYGVCPSPLTTYFDLGRVLDSYATLPRRRIQVQHFNLRIGGSGPNGLLLRSRGPTSSRIVASMHPPSHAFHTEEDTAHKSMCHWHHSHLVIPLPAPIAPATVLLTTSVRALRCHPRANARGAASVELPPSTLHRAAVGRRIRLERRLSELRPGRRQRKWTHLIVRRWRRTAMRPRDQRSE